MIGNLSKKERTKIIDDKINHEEAEKIIDTKSNILITPKAEELPEETYEPEEDKQEKSESENSSKAKQNSTLINDNKKKKNVEVKFISVSAGRTGNIFDAHLEGKTTIIEWNIDHPFYERFVLSNTDNKDLVTAVDYLIYSIATSQLKVLSDSDEKIEIIDQLISVMSNNMRILLS